MVPVIFLIQFAILASSSYSAAEFFNTRNLTVLVGPQSRFTLSCSVNSPYSYIVWSKDGRRLSGSNRISGTLDSSLHVQGITQQDAGMYVCEIARSFDTLRGRFFVEVKEAPSFVVAPESKRVQLGDTVNFECKAKGIPQPRMFWIGGNGASPVQAPRVTIDKENTLVIRNFNERDAGQYTCLARNSYGSARQQILAYAKSKSGSVITPLRRLTYHSKGPQFVKTPSVVQNVDAGIDHTFACSAFGVPLPNVTIGRLRSKQNSTPGEAILIIKNAKVEDSGQYECKARNLYGIIRYVFAVRVKVDGGFSPWDEWSKCNRECGEGIQQRLRRCNNPKPKNGGRRCYGRYLETRRCLIEQCKFPKITMMSYDIRDSKVLKLECHANGVPTPILRWRFNRTPLPYRGNRIAIPKRFARSGKYICEARNLVGYNTVSLSLYL